VIDLARRTFSLGDQRGRSFLRLDQVLRTALLGIGEDLAPSLLGLGGDARRFLVRRTQDRRTLGAEGARQSRFVEHGVGGTMLRLAS